MASVQELIAASQAQQSPLQSLLEGVGQGFQQGESTALERTKQMLEIQQKRAEIKAQAEMNAKIKEQMAKATEQSTQNDLKGVQSPQTSPFPAQRLKQTIHRDAKGNYSTSFETVDSPPTMYTPQQLDAIKSGDSKQLAAAFPTGIPKDAVGQSFSAERIATAESQRDAARSDKQDKDAQKRLTALGDALDPSKQRNGAFGVSKQVFDRAERLQSMAAAAMGNPDRRQMEELAIGVNAMLSGANTGAQQQVAALVPQSLVGDANKFREWLTNDPTGTGQQEFVKRLNDTVAREKATAADQIKRTQFQRVQRYSDLENSHPDDFLNVLQAAGVEPGEYKAWRKGGFKPMSAVQEAPAAGAWTPDKESRYQELLKKKQAGSLNNGTH